MAKNDAYDCAIGLLARREHATQELLAKLRSRGYSLEASQDALRKCQEQHYQDEKRFVEAFCQQRIRQGYGPLHIQQELHAKKVEREFAQKILQEQDVCWLEQARKVVLKKFQHPAKPRTPEWQKQMRFLLYRGFSKEVAAQVLTHLNEML